MNVLDHDHGHWCNRCNRASGTRWFLVHDLTYRTAVVIGPTAIVTTHDAMLMQILVGCTICGAQAKDVTIDVDAYRCHDTGQR